MMQQKLEMLTHRLSEREQEYEHTAETTREQIAAERLAYEEKYINMCKHKNEQIAKFQQELERLLKALAIFHQQQQLNQNQPQQQVQQQQYSKPSAPATSIPSSTASHINAPSQDPSVDLNMSVEYVPTGSHISKGVTITRPSLSNPISCINPSTAQPISSVHTDMLNSPVSAPSGKVNRMKTTGAGSQTTRVPRKHVSFAASKQR